MSNESNEIPCIWISPDKNHALQYNTMPCMLYSIQCIAQFLLPSRSSTLCMLRLQAVPCSLCLVGCRQCLVGIPHICHGHHGQCPCKFILSGVNFSRMNAKIDTFLCNNLTVDTFCVIPLSVCRLNLVQGCNLRNLCAYTHHSVTQRCMVYTMCILFAAFTLSV